MARILDNEGRPLGGLELSFAELLAPLSSAAAPILTPTDIPLPPRYGPNEDVLRLICSYGKLPIVVYSAPESAGNGDYCLMQCRNQVDKPHKRHYCPECGGYYCVTHAEPELHDCQSIYRK